MAVSPAFQISLGYISEHPANSPFPEHHLPGQGDTAHQRQKWSQAPGSKPAPYFLSSLDPLMRRDRVEPMGGKGDSGRQGDEGEGGCRQPLSSGPAGSLGSHRAQKRGLPPWTRASPAPAFPRSPLPTPGLPFQLPSHTVTWHHKCSGRM